MKAGFILLSTIAFGMPFTAQAGAAVVAVMPVQGVNLTEGQCDAIGVLFANAFARETNVGVVSPLDSKPLVAQGQSATLAATQLGVREYIELRAVQLGARITVGGIRYTREGREVFRSETAANGMDDMELTTARLARSLAWRQPIVRPMPIESPEEPSAEPEPAPSTPTGYPKALGVKAGMLFPMSLSSSLSYSPLVSFQFDGRMGTRDAFVEFGVGAAIPADEYNKVSMGGVFVEIGGAVHLSDGSIAPYLGGGVSPRLWYFHAPGREGNTSTEGNTAATCTAYGTAGLSFTRDSRARMYAEIRLSQYLLGLHNNPTYTSYGSYGSETHADTPMYYPTQIDLQVGFGW